MLILPHYRSGRGAIDSYVFVNQEAATYVAAMSVAPIDPLKAIIDTCIGSLKSAGLWSKRDAYYFLNLHDAQAARLNAKNPGTYDLTTFNSPTFTAKVGYAGDGSAAYLSTNFNPSTAGGQFAQNSASFFVWGLKTGQDVGAIFGYLSTAGGCYLYPRFTDDKTYLRINANSDAAPASASGAGLWLASRTASTALALYKGGASVTTAATASAALVNDTLALFRRNTDRYNGGAAMVGFGAGLDATEAANENTILSTFKTAVEAL